MWEVAETMGGLPREMAPLRVGGQREQMRWVERRGDSRARGADGSEPLDLIELRADDVPGIREDKKSGAEVHPSKRPSELDLCRSIHIDLRAPIVLPPRGCRRGP